MQRRAALSIGDRRQSGYLLLPITLLLVLVGVAAYWLSFDAAMGRRAIASEAEADQLEYLLQAAEAEGYVEFLPTIATKRGRFLTLLLLPPRPSLPGE